MSVALPREIGATARILSFRPAKEAANEARHREDFDCLNAQIEAGRRFVSALDALSRCRQLEPSESEMMDALDRALGCAVEATRANDAALLVMDESGGDLVFVLVHGEVPEKKLLWQRVPPGRGVAHWVAAHRRAAIVNSTLNDERFYRGIDIASGFQTRSIVAVPLIHADKVLGVIEVLNKKNGEFFALSDQNHLTVLAHLASALLIRLRERWAEELT